MAVDPLEMVFSLVTSFPINVIIIIGVIGYILYIFYSHRQKGDDAFEIEDFRESVYLAVGKLLDIFGTAIDAYLVRGIEPLGNLTRFYHYKGVMPLMNDKDPKKIKKLEPLDVWIFQIGADKWYHKIIGGGFKNFIIIDDKSLEPYEPGRKRWAIKEDVSFVPYGNVFINSKAGESFANDISFRRAVEEIMTHAQNFPRKVAYLELRQAKVMEKVEAGIEKKSLGYERYKKDVLGSGKDIDDDDNGD